MRQGLRGPTLIGLVTIAIMAAGCAVPNGYRLTVPPSTDPREFPRVEVAPVEVGTIKDTLDTTTVSELRRVLIEQIRKDTKYNEVAPDLVGPGVLSIRPRIVRFDRGSRAARYLVGFGTGKARLHVECTFLNKESGAVVAIGTFRAEVGGGLFGGSGSQTKLAENVAKEVVRFLKKGK